MALPQAAGDQVLGHLDELVRDPTSGRVRGSAFGHPPSEVPQVVGPQAGPPVHGLGQSAGSDDAPWAAPSSAPAMAATVSVSSPACTAETSDATSGRTVADRVPDRRPRGLEGGDDVAVGRERRMAYVVRRPRSRPPTAPVGRAAGRRRSRRGSGSAPSRTASRIAWHHSTHASPASGSWWVSLRHPRAASGEHRRVVEEGERNRGRAHQRPVAGRWSSGAAVEAACVRRAAADHARRAPVARHGPSTCRVCAPTSVAPPSSQSTQPRDDRVEGGRHAVPRSAATRAMTTAIWVSSLHSPGA